MAINSLARMIRDKYGTPTEFHRQSGIQVANYTIARALDNSLDCPALPTVVQIAAYVGMKNNEISEMLTQMGDSFWARLISGEGPSLREQALLDAVRTITNKDEKMWNTLAGNLDLMASAVGVDVSAQLAKIGLQK